MNSPPPDEQHRRAVAFWQQVARAWTKPESPEEHEAMARQAQQAIQAALADMQKHDTRKRIRTPLDDLLGDDED